MRETAFFDLMRRGEPRPAQAASRSLGLVARLREALVLRHCLRCLDRADAARERGRREAAEKWMEKAIDIASRIEASANHNGLTAR